MLTDWGRDTKAAVVVAHPDDEIIWSGGLLLRHPDWNWTVLSLCRADDADRRPKFEAVCERLGAVGIILDLDDGNPPATINPHRDIGGRIRETLCPSPWDICLTHGTNGEYGHPRHKQVHQAVVRLVKNGLLECRELWTFAYECEVSPARCRPADWADEWIDLTDEELAEKKRIVRDMYGYPEDGFEVAACISPEAYGLRQRFAEE
jgi:LmbE family N-acetylglucosaminyl deacetylase